MVAQRRSKTSKYLTVPTRPIPVDRDRSVAGLLEKMEGAGFGAKQLAEAHRVWLDMLEDNSTIYMCGSGNLIPSGMRRLLSFVVKNRFVDVLVLSGSVIFQDIHETLGRNYYQAHPSMSDDELESSDVTRVGDMLASKTEYREADEWIGSVINQLDTSVAYSVREFLNLLGRELAEIAHEDGLLTAAYKAKIPVFCPDLLQTQLSVGIARTRFEKKLQINIDITQDTLDMITIAMNTRNSGIITLGSTCSQQMVNMAEVSSYITQSSHRGHKYAISVTTDSVPLEIRTPSFGGTHTKVFGKLTRDATTAYVPSDPSIALPMLITALSQTAAKYMKGRKRPTFSFSDKSLAMETP